jgi:hypothetical protein
MNRAGNGQPVDYEIRAAQQVWDLLKRHHREAALAGHGHTFLNALRTISERLRKEPMVFGEAQYRLPALKLQVRQGVAHPLVVDYAVHDERPLVLIRGFKVLS